MIKVHETELYSYFVDDDMYIIRIKYGESGKVLEEEIISGECGCFSCNANRDWSEYE